LASQGLLSKVQDLIRDTLSTALRIEADQIDAHSPFADYGLDSIGVGYVVQLLNRALGTELRTTVVFDYSSVNSLATHLVKQHSERIAGAFGETEVQPSTQSKSLARSDTDDVQLEHQARGLITETLSQALRMAAQEIDSRSSFADYGLDSIGAGYVVQLLNRSLGTELQTTVVFDYSCVETLAKHLLSEYRPAVVLKLRGADVVEVKQAVSAPTFTSLSLSTPTTVTAATATVAPRPQTPEPITIIGMSARYPHSPDAQTLWKHLAAGADLVEPVSRWQISGDQKPYAGLLQDIDCFDPLFFNISGLEATYMDPQQRLFLQEAWKALEDAGYVGSSIRGSRCGVYVGYNSGDYQKLLPAVVPAQSMWGNSPAVLSSRISYLLNLQGPAITIDTACSSSLVAIHLACQGLWSGETELGIAGGVRVECTPEFYVLAHRAGMLSPSGRCYAFDDRADGFVPGEGVGVVVLKRLSDALAARDHLYGVISGSGINQDGATNGITAPSALSQERLERSVYDSFGIHPQHIQMMEAHGTGTKLGDPIEFQALTRALGSIKTNLGHTTAAAGVAGVIKILLSLQHRQIPPSLHFERGNSHINFADSPFYVNTQLRDWTVESSSVRRAAVSAFGFSGTNAHMVIEQAPEYPQALQLQPGYLIVLSARTATQLREQVERLLAHCETTDDLDCASVSYTLLLGRMHFEHRWASVVESIDQLRERLSRWQEKGRHAQVFTSHLQEKARREQVSLSRYGNQCIEECAQLRDAASYLERLSVVAELYTQGYELAFDRLFVASPGRVSLPTYPFAKERYWVPQAALKSSAVRPEESGQDIGVGESGDHEHTTAQYVKTANQQVLLAPIWRAREPQLASASRLALEHRVVFVEFEASSYASYREILQAADLHCTTLNPTSRGLEQRFVAYALELFEYVRAVLQEKSDTPVLLQVVIPGGTLEQEVLFALSGLLKSARLENPRFNGQLI
jgi:polyketide synthase PksN